MDAYIIVTNSAKHERPEVTIVWTTGCGSGIRHQLARRIVDSKGNGTTRDFGHIKENSLIGDSILVGE